MDKITRTHIKENKELYQWYAFENTYKEGIDASKVKEVVIWADEIIKKVNKVQRSKDIPLWLQCEFEELEYAIKNIWI
jgi:hypothetical protein